MTFDHLREAMLRMLAKDEQVDREVSQRLYEMAQREDSDQRRPPLKMSFADFYAAAAAGSYPVPPQHASSQRSVRRLWRQPAEPLVSPETATWLEEQFQR